MIVRGAWSPKGAHNGPSKSATDAGTRNVSKGLSGSLPHTLSVRGSC